MTHRKTMGFAADAAESAALTIADPRATERIIEACDYEHDKLNQELEARRLKNREIQRRIRALKRVREKLGDTYADVLEAFLKCRTWEDLGIPRRTFDDRLKKVKIFFEALK
jgi:rubrerythrin